MLNEHLLECQQNVKYLKCFFKWQTDRVLFCSMCAGPACCHFPSSSAGHTLANIVEILCVGAWGKEGESGSTGSFNSTLCSLYSGAVQGCTQLLVYVRAALRFLWLTLPILVPMDSGKQSIAVVQCTMLCTLCWGLGSGLVKSFSTSYALARDALYPSQGTVYTHFMLFWQCESAIRWSYSIWYSNLLIVFSVWSLVASEMDLPVFSPFCIWRVTVFLLIYPMRAMASG